MAAMRAAAHVEQFAKQNGSQYTTGASESVAGLTAYAHQQAQQQQQHHSYPSLMLPGGLNFPGNNARNIPQSDGASDIHDLLSQRQIDSIISHRYSQQSNFADPEKLIPQTDGLDDEEINSDLDDPDEEEEDNDEGEDGDDKSKLMLCLYDKVQRTKNKWKCVLKDGIVTADGKDYVFHRANGEFEW